MSVTVDTSQSERSPLNEEAPKNIKDVSVTPERSGASVAPYAIPDAPSNADSIVAH